MNFSAQVTQGAALTFDYSTTDYPGMAPGSMVRGAFVRSVKLNSASTPKGQDGYVEELTSSQNLDFTALVRTWAAALNATGLKLQHITLQNMSAANAITVVDSGANAYVINGEANLSIPAGGVFSLSWVDALSLVDATHKILQITATAGQKYRVTLVFG